MLLIDLSGVLNTALNESMKSDGNINPRLLRQYALNIIKSYAKKYRDSYASDGEIIIAADSNHYWRKDVFPLYKYKRRMTPHKSGVDWKEIHGLLREVQNEFKSVLPYRVIEADGAEADDVIAHIVHITIDKDILIISSDADFGQLQRYPGVSQYSPSLKQYITIDDPAALLREKIIRGDTGDGIPNILSADDVFKKESRQKSISKKNLEMWMQEGEAEKLEHWMRNQRLIDLEAIPAEIRGKIDEALASTARASKYALLQYMIDQRLGALATIIEEF